MGLSPVDLTFDMAILLSNRARGLIKVLSEPISNRSEFILNRSLPVFPNPIPIPISTDLGKGRYVKPAQPSQGLAVVTNADGFIVIPPTLKPSLPVNSKLAAKRAYRPPKLR